MFLTIACIVVLTFLLNIIADFCKFGTWLDVLQNRWSVVRMVIASCSVAWPHRIRSSTKEESV
jgi:hypothetical protein